MGKLTIHECLSTMLADFLMTMTSGASPQVTRNYCNPPDIPRLSERELTAEGVDVDGEVAGTVETHEKECISLRNNAA